MADQRKASDGKKQPNVSGQVNPISKQPAKLSSSGQVASGSQPAKLSNSGPVAASSQQPAKLPNSGQVASGSQQPAKLSYFGQVASGSQQPAKLSNSGQVASGSQQPAMLSNSGQVASGSQQPVKLTNSGQVAPVPQQPVKLSGSSQVVPGQQQQVILSGSGQVAPQHHAPDPSPETFPDDSRAQASEAEKTETRIDMSPDPYRNSSMNSDENKSPEFYSPVVSVEDIQKPVPVPVVPHPSQSRRDGTAFLRFPKETSNAPHVSWDTAGFHTPPGETAVLVLKDPEPLPPAPVRKPSIRVYSSGDDTSPFGTLNAGANEKAPLLKPELQSAQDLLNKMLMIDRDANRFDDFNWWSFRKEIYPMPSSFSNQPFRQAFAGQILLFKALQMFPVAVVAIVFQMLWTLNSPPPLYVQFIIQHFWVTLIVLAIYLGVLSCVRLFQLGRISPKNWIIFGVLTVLLGFLSFAGSVGLGSTASAISPIVPLTLCISYLIFYVLVIPREWPLRVDVLGNRFYYFSIPIVLISSLMAWTIVCGLLHASGSIFTTQYDLITSFLVDFSLAILIAALILLIENYRLKRIVDGTYISIMADDETLFPSFYI